MAICTPCALNRHVQCRRNIGRPCDCTDPFHVPPPPVEDPPPVEEVEELLVQE